MYTTLYLSDDVPLRLQRLEIVAKFGVRNYRRFLIFKECCVNILELCKFCTNLDILLELGVFAIELVIIDYF